MLPKPADSFKCRKNGKNFEDPADISQQFNNYFEEIGQSIANT